jgi:hypothetical protein
MLAHMGFAELSRRPNLLIQPQPRSVVLHQRPRREGMEMKAKDIWRAVNTWAIYNAIAFVVITSLFSSAKGATADFFGIIAIYGLWVIVARTVSWLWGLPSWAHR